MGKNYTQFICAGAAALMLSGAVSASAEVTFNAVVSYPTNNAGVYSFTTKEYDPQLIKRNVFASGGGIAYDDGYFYGSRVETVMGITAIKQTSYALDTWEEYESYTGTAENVATANTFDADLGQAYGCYYNADGETFRFGAAKVPYWSATTIAPLEKPWGACGFNRDYVLYAVDVDGRLSTVNTDNGALTAVGETGLKNEWITGGFIDKDSNTMIYAIKNDTETALYSIDLATARATRLYELANEEQLGGFHVPAPEYAADAPAASSSASMSFSGVNLSGNFYFYPPNKTVGGNAGDGALTYHVYCNGKEIASGETKYGGSRTTVPVSVEKAGYYCLAVSFSNAAGEGPRKRTDAKWLGYDTPQAPTRVSVSYPGNEVKVSWSISSSGIHGGTTDTSNRIYRVTRYPEGIVVSPADLKQTNFIDKFELPSVRTTYWYTVECIAGDKTSAASKSAEFSLGPIAPPYETQFEVSSDFFGYTTLNPGADTNQWSIDSSGHYVRVSSSKSPADNYLLLPVLDLKAGMSYEFTMQARSYSSSYEEEFEVLAGTAPTAEALTTPVIAKSKVKGSDWTEFTGTITAAADGAHYVAVHATTPAKGGYLYVNSIKITGGVSDLAPAGVSNLKATADATGAHSATFTFTTPNRTLGGENLEHITYIDLLCDGKIVKTVSENIAPSAEMTIVDDTNPSAGLHTYSVICHNSYGAGAEAKVSVFIGFSAPEAVTEVRMTEPSNGHVVATWTPVTKDSEGRVLTAADVKYNVYKYLAGELYPVATAVEGTTYEYEAFDGFEAFDGQRFVQTIVEAVTEGGTAKRIPSAQTAVGNPYTAPWSESFANCEVKSIFANNAIKGTDVWQMLPYDDYGTTPADNDGGLMYLEAYGRGACALLTGKIDLGDMFSPAFVFQVFHYASSSPNENVFEVEVRTPDTDYVPVYSSKIMDMGPEGEWCKVVVPLDEFAGQIVQLRIAAYNNAFGFSHMDDLRITSVAANNLALQSLSAPTDVDADTDFSITAVIENIGTERAIGSKVILYRDEEPIASENAGALENGDSRKIVFTDNLGVLAEGKHIYKAEIEYGPDMYEGDNSLETTVIVRANTLPKVTDLQGTAANGNVTLSWSKPATLEIPVATTENFDATSLSWATSVPGWTMHDIDKGTIGGIGNRQIPVSGRQSFFVLDNTHSSLQNGNISAFKAHSGNQYLCSMYSNVGGRMVQSDDWAVSPELDGCAQTISLWATSFPADPEQTQYLETFQILYSTTGTEPEDFTLVKQFTNIPFNWTEYSAYLPEGTKHFAIRCISYNQYMLFVDDVKFIPANSDKKSVELSGYNVYRDGHRLNAEPMAENSYVDKDIDGISTYSYAVTAVYTEGESMKSNEISVDTSLTGIGSTMAGDVTISASAGAAIVTGAEGMRVEIFATDGTTVAALPGETHMSIDLQAGFYIVRVGSTVAKIAVR